MLFRPVDPAGEMFRLDLVALDRFAVGLRINRMQIQPLFSGEEREDFFDISAQFIGIAGAARIVAGHGDAAVKRVAVLKPGDVIALPAVETHRNLVETLECRFDIHTEIFVNFLRRIKHGSHLLTP